MRYKLTTVFILFLSVSIFATPSFLLADSTLNFPRLSFDPNLLSGVAIVNPSSQDAFVTLTAFGSDGGPLVGAGIHNPVQISIPAGQQFSKVMSEIFGSGLGPDSVAWFQASSLTDGLTGFFLILNSSLTLLDGADLPAASRKIIFNHVRLDSGFTTELDIVNPGTEATIVQLQLVASDSSRVIEQLVLPAKGVVRIDPASFFEVTDVSAGAYVTVSADSDIAGFEFIRGPSGDGFGLNAFRAADELSTLFFLQLSVLGNNSTQLHVVNYSADPAVVTVTAFKPDGSLYDALNLKTNPVVRALPGSGSLREDIEAMFGFSGSEPLDGWLTVQSTSPAVNGFLSYGTTSTGPSASITSAAQGRTRAIFSHIATASGLYTGIAALNPGTLAANLRIVVIKPTGELLGSFDTVLQPGQRINKRLGSPDFLPEAADQIGGFVWIKSSLPVYVSSLIGSDNAFSNIPAQDAPDSFNPDAALASLKIKPSLAIVPPGISQRFQLDGASSANWKVNGSAGGSTDSGTISSSGVFTAPKSVPARQVVTITAESNRQSAGASADVLDKTPFATNLLVIQSVAYVGSLHKIYAAELAALSEPHGSSEAGTPAADAAPDSQLFEIPGNAPQIRVASFPGANIVKMLAFPASDDQEYLLLADQTGGRIIRFSPTTQSAIDVVTALNRPSSMVIDPATGDLFVVEQDKVSTVPKDVLQSGLSSAPAGSHSLAVLSDFEALKAISINGVAGIAADSCTGNLYFSLPLNGTIVEYNPGSNISRIVASGLLDPGQLLGIHRQGITCPFSFHLLVTERGRDRVDLIVPSDLTFTSWSNAAGIQDLAFLPATNPFLSTEAVILGGFTPELKGYIFLVPIFGLYQSKAANPSESSLVERPADLEVSQTPSPLFVIAGDTATFSLRITNHGPFVATGVTIVDTLPPNITAAEASTDRGDCRIRAVSLLCSIGTLPLNGTATVTVRIVADSLNGSLSLANVANVSAIEVDPNLSNNRSTGPVSLLPSQTVNLEISGIPDPVTAGVPYTITVTPKDSAGNIVDFNGNLHFSSTDLNATLPPDVGSRVSSRILISTSVFKGTVVFRTLGLQTISVRDTTPFSLASGSLTVRVDPPTAGAEIPPSGPPPGTTGPPPGTSTPPPGTSNPPPGTSNPPPGTSPPPPGTSAPPVTAGFQVVVVPDHPNQGVASGVTVRAADALGNTVPGYRGTVRFTSTDPGATLPADYTFTTADAGIHTFTGGLVLKAPGTQTVTVTDVSVPSIIGSLTVQVNQRVVGLILEGIPDLVFGGRFYDVTVRAVDMNGNVVPGYRGTISFTATSPTRVVLPANYTFTAADAGVHTFTQAVKFRADDDDSGNHDDQPHNDTIQLTITVTDIAAADINGSKTVNVAEE